MEKVYKIKDEFTKDDLVDLGFEEINSADHEIYVKVLRQPLESELPQSIINGFYNNPNWKEKIYKPNRVLLEKAMKLYYDDDGKVIINKDIEDIVCEWRIQVDLIDDRWLGFTSGDPFDREVFYSTKVLDRYCGDEIQNMLQYIDVIEVDE